MLEQLDTPLSLQEQILDKLQSLPENQQLTVLNFIQSCLPVSESSQSDNESMSALEAAQNVVEWVDGGPGDLAHNKAHFAVAVLT
jgi:hypothetical protein